MRHVAQLLWLLCLPVFGAQPPGFPVPTIVEANPVTPEKVRLGRTLFFDERLSASGEVSCASCHDPEQAFTDSRGDSTGGEGDRLPTNAMSLANLAYRTKFGWFEPAASTLEEQMLRPLFNTSPVEMGLTGHEDRVLANFQNDPQFMELYRQAFPETSLSIENIIKAIASYERSLISGRSEFDAWVFDGIRPEPNVIRGFALFDSTRLGCSACHGGLFFSNEEFLNVRQGLPRILVPTLRNIEVTAPYFHDGSKTNLDEVIDHYASAPNAELGLTGFSLTPAEREDLKAFLRSLTDKGFLSRSN